MFINIRRVVYIFFKTALILEAVEGLVNFKPKRRTHFIGVLLFLFSASCLGEKFALNSNNYLNQMAKPGLNKFNIFRGIMEHHINAAFGKSKLIDRKNEFLKIRQWVSNHGRIKGYKTNLPGDIIGV